MPSTRLPQANFTELENRNAASSSLDNNTRDVGLRRRDNLDGSSVGGSSGHSSENSSGASADTKPEDLYVGKLSLNVHNSVDGSSMSGIAALRDEPLNDKQGAKSRTRALLTGKEKPCLDASNEPSGSQFATNFLLDGEKKKVLEIEYQKFLEAAKWLDVDGEAGVYYKCSPPLQKLIRIRSGQDSALVQRVNPPSEEESRTLDKEEAIFEKALRKGTRNMTRTKPSPELLAFLQEIKDLWTYEQKLKLLDEYPFHVKEEILKVVNPRVDVSKLRSGEVKIRGVDIYMMRFRRAHEGNEEEATYPGIHSSDEKVRLEAEFNKFLEDTKWLNVEEEVEEYYKCSPPLQKLIRIRSGQDSALVQRVNPPSEEESRTLDKEEAIFEKALRKGTRNMTRTKPSPELLAFLQEIKDLWTYEQKLKLLEEYPFHVKEEILKVVNPRFDVSKLRSGEVKIRGVDIYMMRFHRAYEGNEEEATYPGIHSSDEKVRLEAEFNKFLEDTKWLNVDEEVEEYYKCSPPLQKLIRIRSGQDSALVQRVNPPSEEESRTLDKEEAIFEKALRKGTRNVTGTKPSPELLAFLQEIKDLWTYEQKLKLLEEYPFHVKEEILKVVNPRVDVSKLRSGEVKIHGVDIYMMRFRRAHEGNEDAVKYHPFDSDIKNDVDLIHLIH